MSPMILRPVRSIISKSINIARRSFSSSSSSIGGNDDRPEFDFDYLLNPANLDSIRANIANRKQVGDIDQVHKIWNRLSSIILSTGGSQQLSNILRPTELKSLWDEFYEACEAVPNRSHPSTPIGDDDRLVETIGGGETTTTTTTIDFQPHSAEQIAVMLRAMKFATQEIGTTAGEKAYFLYDNLALLEQALIDYSLSIVQQKKNKKSGRRDFELIYVPDVLNERVPKKCGLTTRTELNIVYTVKDERYSDYCLSGTGEMGIASYLENRTFQDDDDEEEELPKKFVTISRCYRPEVAYGKIARGLYRVHEFTKVEMFAVSKDDAEESERVLREFVEIQKEIVRGLELHCRLLEMPTRELGAPAYHKFDIEAWMPGRNVFGEISSASNCTDYQSRRLRMRYKTASGEYRYVHTVNGTACATSRMIIALIEQHQKKNKLVMIPDALKPFFNNWPALYPNRMQLKMSSHNPRMFRNDNGQEEGVQQRKDQS